MIGHTAKTPKRKRWGRKQYLKKLLSAEARQTLERYFRIHAQQSLDFPSTEEGAEEGAEHTPAKEEGST